MFCLYHPPEGQTLRGRVLHLHPFAEELNTCRRISAQFARELAQAGYAVLQFDMFGCGDSEGEFSYATWADWLNNTLSALEELKRLSDASAKPAPLWLWGVRSGALLASGAAGLMTEPANILCWQPVTTGRQVLQQWLRLQAAKEWLTHASSAHASPSLPDQLKNGQAVTVAGYTITPALAEGLTAAEFAPLASPRSAPGRLEWLALSQGAEAEPSPGLLRAQQRWDAAGWITRAQCISGPAFWQQITTADVPELLHGSMARLT